MGQSFIITLREGLEAALIVAIVLAYLRQVESSQRILTLPLSKHKLLN